MGLELTEVQCDLAFIFFYPSRVLTIHSVYLNSSIFSFHYSKSCIKKGFIRNKVSKIFSQHISVPLVSSSFYVTEPSKIERLWWIFPMLHSSMT